MQIKHLGIMLLCVIPIQAMLPMRLMFGIKKEPKTYCAPYHSECDLYDQQKKIDDLYKKSPVFCDGHNLIVGHHKQLYQKHHSLDPLHNKKEIVQIVSEAFPDQCTVQHSLKTILASYGESENIAGYLIFNQPNAVAPLSFWVAHDNSVITIARDNLSKAGQLQHYKPTNYKKSEFDYWINDHQILGRKSLSIHELDGADFVLHTFDQESHTFTSEYLPLVNQLGPFDALFKECSVFIYGYAPHPTKQSDCYFVKHLLGNHTHLHTYELYRLRFKNKESFFVEFLSKLQLTSLSAICVIPQKPTTPSIIFTEKGDPFYVQDRPLFHKKDISQKDITIPWCLLSLQDGATRLKKIDAFIALQAKKQGIKREDFEKFRINHPYRQNFIMNCIARQLEKDTMKATI